jgi:hypothetical protein
MSSDNLIGVRFFALVGVVTNKTGCAQCLLFPNNPPASTHHNHHRLLVTTPTTAKRHKITKKP